MVYYTLNMLYITFIEAEVRSSFITTTVREHRPRSHHKGATGRVRTGESVATPILT